MTHDINQNHPQFLRIQVSEGKDAPKCGNFLLTTPERLFNTMYNTSALHQYNLEYILPHTNTSTKQRMSCDLWRPVIY